MEERRDNLNELRREIGRQTARLDVIHADRLACRRGCNGCCVDDITVHPVEAEVIRRRHIHLLAEGAPHPEGACAFLDDVGACRIYEDRPYVCRTQGYPLRWVDEGPDGGFVEYRDICPLNDGGEPLIEAISPDDCWTLGPVEERLAALQVTAEAGGPPAGRVRLRDLFDRPPGGPTG